MKNQLLENNMLGPPKKFVKPHNVIKVLIFQFQHTSWVFCCKIATFKKSDLFSNHTYNVNGVSKFYPIHQLTIPIIPWMVVAAEKNTQVLQRDFVSRGHSSGLPLLIGNRVHRITYFKLYFRELLLWVQRQMLKNLAYLKLVFVEHYPPPAACQMTTYTSYSIHPFHILYSLQIAFLQVFPLFACWHLF